MTTVRIEGASELDRVLRLLPEEISRRVVSAALRAGTPPVVAEMKARLSYSLEAEESARARVYRHRKKGAFTGDVTVRFPGYAKSQIRARPASKSEMSEAREILQSQNVSAAFLVGASRKAFYLRFLEWGWMHTTSKASGRKRTKHIPAHPRLRPACDATKRTALNLIGRALGKGIERAAEKLARPFFQSPF